MEAWNINIPMLIKGGYSRRDQDAENPTFIVESLTRLAELRATGQFAVSLELDSASGLPLEVMRDVRAVAMAHPGAAPLELNCSAICSIVTPGHSA